MSKMFRLVSQEFTHCANIAKPALWFASRVPEEL